MGWSPYSYKPWTSSHRGHPVTAVAKSLHNTNTPAFTYAFGNTNARSYNSTTIKLPRNSANSSKARQAVNRSKNLSVKARDSSINQLNATREWNETFEVLPRMTWQEAVAWAKENGSLIDLNVDRPFTPNELYILSGGWDVMNLGAPPLEMRFPAKPAVTLRKFITMQRKKVVVTFKYSGGAGLKRSYIAAAEKVKKRFDEVHIQKEILPVVSAVDSGLFEIWVDDKLVYRKPRERAAVYLRMRTIHWAIIKAKRRRRPGQRVYGDPFTLPAEYRPNITSIMEAASRKQRTRERLESARNAALSFAKSTKTHNHKHIKSKQDRAMSSSEVLLKFHEARRQKS